MQNRGGKWIFSLTFVQIILLMTASIASCFILSSIVSAEIPPTTAPAATGSSSDSLEVIKGKTSELGGGTQALTGAQEASSAIQNGISAGTKSVQVQDGVFNAQIYNYQGAEYAKLSNGAVAKWTPGAQPGTGSWNVVSGEAPYSKNILGLNVQGGFAPLVEGLMWSGIAFAAISFLGPMIGLDKKNTNALSLSAVAGIMTWKGLASLGPRGFGVLGPNNFLLKYSGLVGIAVGVGLFLFLYKTEKQKYVNFQCLPYEPPIGGRQCETCNKDPFRPCSEYRCKSLGQACQLLNKGTDKEQCTWVNPKDVTSPVITPDNGKLSPSGLSYKPDTAIRPPQLGVKIVKLTSSTGCLPAFTPLQFGFNTNEPSQCKIDYNIGNGTLKGSDLFDSMQFYVGESNYYSYNHTEIFRLPGPDNDSGSPLYQNDGTFRFYIVCRDANGNTNDDVYSVGFCADKGPDTTPPIIENTSIVFGSPVQFGQSTIPIEAYVNEPSQCKWSSQDKDYKDMENTMNCATQPSEINANFVYTCSGNLTGIQNKVGSVSQDSTFYFRCKDQPSLDETRRNVMSQSYKLTLRGSQPLNILSIAPNGTISASTDTVNVKLEVETSAGADEGKAACYFGNTNYPENQVLMFKTNEVISSQTLSLTNGNYNYYVRCIDAAGNTASKNTSFNIFTDKSAPQVTRVYKEEPDALKVVTNENAVCTYSTSSCVFNSNEGLSMVAQDKIHFAQWKPRTTYYVKCVDDFGNEPDPSQCSIIVGATQNIVQN